MESKLYLHLTHTLPGEFEIVYKALADFRKFGELHPYITQVNVLKDKSPDFIEYEIKEEICFLGFIKSQPVYTARVMEPEKNKHIRYTSQVKKKIFLSINFTFSKTENNKLVVNELIEVEANKFIGRVFLNILKKAHLRFFKNMELFLHTSIEDHHPRNRSGKLS